MSALGFFWLGGSTVITPPDIPKVLDEPQTVGQFLA
jgi:hypothetical protein